jgi:Na+/H+ antiporter NhaD/arsenite permease-like protein
VTGKRIPRRLFPVVFGFLLSGLMTLVVSAITTYRNLGFDGAFVRNWLTAFVSAWSVTFPTATVVAPFVRRLVERIVSDQ